MRHVNISVCISFLSITFKTLIAHIASCMHAPWKVKPPLNSSLKDCNLQLPLFFAFLPCILLYSHSMCAHAWTDMCSEHFERYRLKRYTNTAIDASNTLFFFLAPAVTSHFVFRIFLVNSGSYKFSSSGIFYVLSTKNLAVHSFVLFLGNLHVQLCSFRGVTSDYALFNDDTSLKYPGYYTSIMNDN